MALDAALLNLPGGRRRVAPISHRTDTEEVDSAASAPLEPASAAFIALLAEAVGSARLRTSRADLDRYGADETEDLVYRSEVVVLPETRSEVEAVMRLADAHRVAVTPRGAGTGLSGGALPVRGGIVLSLERMNRIVEVDRRNLVAVVEPGVVTQTLQEAVEEVGLFYPPDPASRGSCFIGGNVAHGAGGPRAVKYGTTRDYVLGLEAVLPGGRVIRTGGKLRKHAAGYALHQLLVSSEGTLAVVTEVTLRLLPLPAHRVTLLAPFPSMEAALGTLVAAFERGVVPAAAEFLERDAIVAAAAHLGVAPPAADAAALLLFEVDGRSAARVAEEAEAVGAACLDGGALDVLVADDPPRQRELWRLRRAVGEAVKSISPYREIDAVVPIARIAELVAGAKRIARDHGLDAICYGHAGDGNIHINVLKRDLPDTTWRERIEQAAGDLYTFVAGLGGALSGEHGVGLVGRGHLERMLGAETIDVMRAVKRAFDPHGILNPGKIF